MIGCLYKATTYLDALINPTTFALPNPHLYTVARISLWALYGFWAGLFATGIWVIGHECGHQSFSESKTINNTVGWILHSAYVVARNIILEVLTLFSRLGVPYHAWRITHAKHHASTGHMTQDQVFVPSTRSELGLRPFDPSKEDLLGARVISEVKKEMWEALGDSPIGAALESASYLVSFHRQLLYQSTHFVYLQLGGWPAYIITNASGQKRYPKGTTRQFTEILLKFRFNT